MQIQPIKSFQQQHPTQKSSIYQHNMRLIKKYLKGSRISLISWLIMLIMFFISLFYTYTQNQYYRGGYSFMQFNPMVLKSLGGNVPALIKQGQIHRLFTAIFLHAGLLHFVMNSMSIFGMLMLTEQMYKFKYFLITFIIGGIQGNMFSSLINLLRNKGNIVAIGASTSICAIFGLSMATMYIDNLRRGNVENVKKKIGFVLVALLITSLLPGVDVFGHLGSLIAGGLFGLGFNCTVLDFNDQMQIIKKIRIIAKVGLVVYFLLLLLIFFI